MYFTRALAPPHTTQIFVRHVYSKLSFVTGVFLILSRNGRSLKRPTSSGIRLFIQYATLSNDRGRRKYGRVAAETRRKLPKFPVGFP